MPTPGSKHLMQHLMVRDEDSSSSSGKRKPRSSSSSLLPTLVEVRLAEKKRLAENHLSARNLLADHHAKAKKDLPSALATVVPKLGRSFSQGEFSRGFDRPILTRTNRSRQLIHVPRPSKTMPFCRE